MSVTEQDHVYFDHDGMALQALVYRPEAAGDGPVPVVIDVHGGAWSSGHRKSGRHYDRALASAGICVVSIDFRQAPDYQHPAAQLDIAEAIRWTLEADEIGVSRKSLGLIGSSSGGHLAMHTALNPGELIKGAGFLDEINYLIALWPVSNPIARYQYVKGSVTEPRDPNIRFEPERLALGHEQYFPDMAAMSDAAIQNILLTGNNAHLPDLFIVQPELDYNVPPMMSLTLKGAWQLAGGNVTYKLYPGVGHGFAHGESEQSGICIEDMIEYIGRY